MKLMFCQDCGDVVSPSLKNHEVRWCMCGRHALWWENGATGDIRLHDAVDKQLPYPKRPRAFVLGIANSLLTSPDEKMTSSSVQILIDAIPSKYVFKMVRSLIIRIRPGESSDSAWAHLPKK